MKKIFLLVFTLSITISAQEGWFQQNPLPTENDLTSVFFVSSNIGWAVGTNGTIIKTVDGGSNWIVQESATSNLISDIFFIDENNGWAVGYQIILSTTDGGLNWISQSCIYWLESVFFIDHDVGWIGFHLFGH